MQHIHSRVNRTSSRRAAPRHTLIGRWVALLLVICLLVGLSGDVIQTLPVSALPLTGGGGGSASVPAGDFMLEIPEIGVNLAVDEAYVRGDTWDFGVFRHEAAHLQLTAFPGEGSNVVIGAHYELANFVPGPFIDLDQLVVGDRITLQYQGRTYIYEVSETLLVDPSEVYVAYGTPEEMLTLLTCYSYSGAGIYARRYVVRAPLVEVL